MPGTPRQVLAKKERRRLRAMRPRPHDGLFIAWLKRSLTGELWHRPYRAFVEFFLKRSGEIDREMDDPLVAVHHAADVYTLLASAIVAICYATQLVVARHASGDLRAGLALALCLPGLFRMIESFAVIAMLHANGHYQSVAPMRGVSRTIWTYLDFVMIFASFYVTLYCVAGDSFSRPPDAELIESWVSPLYFSMMTIGTVGFGDFHPQTAAGRLVASFEVFCGVVLLVVALQRAMAAIPEAASPDDAEE